MGTQWGRRFLAAGWVLVACVFGWGCMTCGLQTCHDGEEGCRSGGVSIRVYDTPSSLRHDLLTERPVRSLLIRPAPGGEEVVHSAEGPAWTVEGVPPGRYRLSVSVTEEDGTERSRTKELEVLPGRGVEAQVVLRNWHVPFGWTVVSAAVAGVALVIVEDSMSDWHLFDDGGPR